MGKSAYTLVELLAAMAVGVTLLSLGVVQLAGASRTARAAGCLENLRQIGAAALAYAADNGGVLPQSSHQGPSRAWTKVLKDQLPARVFRSPLDDTGRTLSYAINDFVTERPAGAKTVDFSRLQSQPAPSQTLLMGVLHPNQQNSDHFHFAEVGFQPSVFAAEAWTKLFQNAGHYLFVDGHAARLRWTDVQILLVRPGSRFIRPDGLNP